MSYFSKGGIINTSVTYDGNNVKFVNPISGASEESDQVAESNVFSESKFSINTMFL